MVERPSLVDGRLGDWSGPFSLSRCRRPPTLLGVELGVDEATRRRRDRRPPSRSSRGRVRLPISLLAILILLLPSFEISLVNAAIVLVALAVRREISLSAGSTRTASALSTVLARPASLRVERTCTSLLLALGTVRVCTWWRSASSLGAKKDASRRRTIVPACTPRLTSEWDAMLVLQMPPPDTPRVLPLVHLITFGALEHCRRG